jgi:hypothetical protein
LVDWHNKVTLTSISSAVCEAYSEDLQIAKGATYAVGADTKSMTIVKISPDQRCLTQKFALYVTSLAAIGSSIVFVVDFHDIFICKASDFPLNSQHLLSEIEAIARLVCDETIGVLVIIAKSGLLKIVSLLDGTLRGTLDFVGMGLRTVLITETWHLIVIECELKIYIATIYGKVLKVSEIFKPIAKAVAFRILNGNDFVALFDCDGALRIFEVFYPEKMQLLTKIKNQVVALEYLRDHQAILVIEQDGRLSKLTFPQIGQ